MTQTQITLKSTQQEFCFKFDIQTLMQRILQYFKMYDVKAVKNFRHKILKTKRLYKKISLILKQR